MTKKQRIFSYFLIVIGVLIVGFFGVRALHSFRHLREKGPYKPPHGASEVDIDLIRDWMTVPYITHSYGLPERVIFKMMKIPPDPKNAQKSLKELNDEFYPQMDGAVLQYVKAAVQAFQIHQPPPPFPSTPLPPPPTATP